MITTKGYMAILALSLIGAAIAIVQHQAIPAFLLGWVFGEALHLLYTKAIIK